MAEITPGPNNPLGGPEPAMDKRMLIAFLMMAAILFATPYFYRAFGPQNPTPARQQQAPVKTDPKSASQTPAPQAAVPAPPAAPVSAAKDEERVIETDLFRIRFANRGAVVRSWVLKKFKDSSGKPLDLVNTTAAAKTGFPFQFAYKDHKPSAELNTALFAMKQDGLGITFSFSDGRTAAEKSFRFLQDSYLWELTSSVTENGGGVQHLLVWRGGFGDAQVENPEAQRSALHFDVPSQKLVLQQAKVASDGPVDQWGQYSFAGVQDMYFAAAFLPRGGSQTQMRIVSDTVAARAGRAEAAQVGAAVGGDVRNRFEVFVGPKDVDLLRKVSPRLEQLVDFGTWFGWLAKPLFVSLNYLNDNYVHNYGWSIIVATVIINLLLMPLRLSSVKSMRGMAKAQPEIQAINAKYKGVGMRDPRNQEKNAEVMEVYKKHGINPMGGCLPLLLQFPFFIAFYTVLTVAIQMRGASWLWVPDLSHPETIPIRILPIAMIVAQFAQQKLTPTPSADPAQQRMMQFMPIMFGIFFYGASSGLVLYWLTSNLVGIAQQLILNKVMGVPAVPQTAAARAVPAKQKTGKKR